MVTGYNWKLVDAGGADDIGYKIKVSDVTETAGYNNGNISTEDLAQGSNVISFTSSAAQWAERASKMELTTAYSNQAGNFSDSLTFTAEVN